MKRIYDDTGVYIRDNAAELYDAVNAAVWPVFKQFEGIYPPQDIELVFMRSASLSACARHLKLGGLRLKQERLEREKNNAE